MVHGTSLTFPFCNSRLYGPSKIVNLFNSVLVESSDSSRSPVSSGRITEGHNFAVRVGTPPHPLAYLI